MPRIVIVGIDEAGYGPMLGPLVVGMTAFRVENAEKVPDLWEMLDRAVSRKLSDSKSRLPVADSKKLKLSNSGRRHPLTHLERAALAFMTMRGQTPADDGELFTRLGTRLSDQPWYAGPPAPVPCANSAPSLALDASVLRSACARAGVSFLDARALCICEDQFNRIVDRTGTKASTTARAIVRHIRRIASSKSAADPETRVCVACDRLGGRTRYSRLLRVALPGWRVDEAERTPARSTYSCTSADGIRRIAFCFQPEAETAFLPVALASIYAKYVRELAMARMNRHFIARIPELKPTAGYTTDARRWLRDAGSAITDEERRTLVRIS